MQHCLGLELWDEKPKPLNIKIWSKEANGHAWYLLITQQWVLQEGPALQLAQTHPGTLKKKIWTLDGNQELVTPLLLP